MLVNVLYPILAIFGIGLVIFVHELGHFLAARAVGIRVEAFSIGFGRKIWGFRRGPTEYKVCLIPLGGYVKMAGEDPTRPTTGAPDEFGSKTVWQRTLVISAGVIMNMVFAIVAIPIAFSVGVPFDVPIVGAVEPEGPAWEAGLKRGDRVLEIDGEPVLSFEDIRLEVAVSSGPLDLLVARDGKKLRLRVRPVEGPEGFPQIGIVPSLVTEFQLDEELFSTDGKDEIGKRQAEVLMRAGLRPGDVLVGLDGIPVDRFRLWNAEIERVGEGSLELLVRRGEQLEQVTVGPVMEGVPDSERWFIGIQSLPEPQVEVSKVVPGDLADEAGLAPGDVILSIGGQPFTSSDDLARRVGSGHDPRRTALLEGFPDPPGWEPTLRMEIERKGARRAISIALPTREDRVAFLESFTWSAETSTRIDVVPDMPSQAAGLRKGDVIVGIDGHDVTGFQDITRIVHDCEGRALDVRVRRGDAEQTFTVNPVKKAVSRNVVLRGARNVSGPSALLTENVQYPFPESVHVGFVYMGRMLQQVVKTLRSILRGSVSAKNLGGPITIFRASYHYSQVGIMRGLLFMAFISVNLAILNILPIPVLDGGWLLFLIIEKIKGSPVSERTMAYFQWLGFAFILGLMLFVTWNDLQRLFAHWFG